MPAGPALDMDWIDENSSYLHTRIGRFPLFEPSGLFYAELGRCAAAEERLDSSTRPLRQIYDHIAFPGVMLHFENDLKNPGEFRFSYDPKNPDVRVPVCIRIAGRYRKIPDENRRGMAIAAIIAHEVAHYYLNKMKILRATEDNERLTDLALILLGFGKLWINGSNLVVEERPEQLGYLRPLDMTYALMEYARRNDIPESRLRAELSMEGLQFFSFWLGRLPAEVDACRQLQARQDTEDAVKELLKTQKSLLADAHRIADGIGNLKAALAAAIQDQEIISSTHAFWEIGTDDDRVMGAFVSACATAIPETEIRSLARSAGALEKDVTELGTGLQQPSAVNCSPAIFRQVIDRDRHLLAGIVERALPLERQVAAVREVHARCFAQIGFLAQETGEIRAIGNEILNDARTLCTLYDFVAGGRAAWPDVTVKGKLKVTVRNPPGEADTLCALPRGQYTGRLPAFPPAGVLRGQLQQMKDEAEAERRSVRSTIRELARIPDEYLSGADDLKARIGETEVSCTALGNDIRQLGKGQDRINAGHGKLALGNADADMFVEISRATSTAIPESELAEITGGLAKAQAALNTDIQRIRNRTEAPRILPLDSHRQAVADLRYRYTMLLGKISHWQGVQKGYLDALDEQERRTFGNLLRTAGGKLRDALKK